MSTDTSIRLNKFISDSGFCSRREADQYIEDGRVSINNRTAKKGATVKPGDKVAVDGEPIRAKKPSDRAVYIAFNKPTGITTTTDPNDKKNIIDFIGFPKRIFPIGRLDNASEGLILLTNDGDIVNKILRADNNHEKEYVVMVDKPVTDDFVKQMSNGVRLAEGLTKKAVVHQQGHKAFRIVLTQGLNRQIRRMCETLGYKVEKLKRVRIMNIKLADLPTGHWRYLTLEELKTMNQLLADSSKFEDASTWGKEPRKKAVEAAPEEEEDIMEEFGVKVHRVALPRPTRENTYENPKAKSTRKPKGSAGAGGASRDTVGGSGPKRSSAKPAGGGAPGKSGRQSSGAGSSRSARPAADQKPKRTAGTRGRGRR
ncbi:23S rRNA pseudouridine(2604) synthase RluF [Rufibacter immobilis]|uniref:Pseudouridine synthase n=1 Tax=Rufibacter immobilis TaxID=1348778 RepID=A0A3M9MRZ8_9BACT|nr:23S rRNA pseudouridine(2604) synthase RluF [Rufibacter immobilis]RNI28302.1 23S rRNA pseudouridine(2604) synthase RluF [Rufibacter immobilis]